MASAYHVIGVGTLRKAVDKSDGTRTAGPTGIIPLPEGTGVFPLGIHRLSSAPIDRAQPFVPVNYSVGAGTVVLHGGGTPIGFNPNIEG